MPDRPLKVTLISLEPWDGVWRRNQHLAAQLVGQGLVERLTFVEPPLLRGPAVTRSPLPGIDVVTAPLPVPKRLGGYRLAGRVVRAAARDDDVVWVNDPAFGIHCIPRGVPAVYDVTDDWRTIDQPERIRRRLVRAEDALARRARTVVCSDVLRRRWEDRYGVDAALVHNGIDADAWADVEAQRLPGPRPHVGYVGTLHEDRLDVDLVARTAADPRVGTVHLVGPDALSETSRRHLLSAGVVLHGAVPAEDVPRWTRAMDVLVSPHRVSDFTLSLDAIKAREYRASGRPVVATPTSGFQHLSGEQFSLASREGFPDAVAEASTRPSFPPGPAPGDSWAERAREFHAILASAYP